LSLNWDISKIDNYEELLQETPEGKRLDGLTEALIWKSMVTGLGKGWALDAEFAPEFFARIKLLEKLDGPLYYTPILDEDGKPTGKHEQPLVTIEDVIRRIGLHVNVSPVSRTQFLKNAVVVDLDRDVQRYKDKTLVIFGEATKQEAGA